MSFKIKNRCYLNLFLFMALNNQYLYSLIHRIENAWNKSRTNEKVNKIIRANNWGKLSLILKMFHTRPARKMEYPSRIYEEHFIWIEIARHGIVTILSDGEEFAIADWILESGRWGFGKVSTLVRKAVKQVFDKAGRFIATFQSNLPGETCFNWSP